MKDMIIRGDAPGATQGWAEFEGLRYRCTLGRGGIRMDKKEGDGATPIGRFPLRRLLYRPDRGTTPDTKLALLEIRPQDGWCDAPEDIAYNRPITLPYAASHEVMWRADHLYDRVLVIGHNDDPVVPGLGSAIFMHLAHDDYRWTDGCVAFSAADFDQILARLAPEDRITILAP